MTDAIDVLDAMEDMDETAATSKCCSRQVSGASRASRQTSHDDDQLPSRRTCSQQPSDGGGYCQESLRDCHAQSKITPNTSISSISTAATVEHILPVILLDWDDTLCPTTWLKEDCAVDWREPLDQVLKPGRRRDIILGLLGAHIARVHEFMLASSKIGHIVIVTLAEKSWVDVSIRNWMPTLEQTLRDCKVEIVYAQDFLSDDDTAFFDKQDENVWIEAKSRAMQWALRKLEQPWNNCVSIGDSWYEIDGMVHAREALVKSGVFFAGQCHTSTLKLMEGPTVQELTAELQVAQTWLPYMANRTADFDGEIGSPLDDELQQLHTQITGALAPGLSWANFIPKNPC